ncbi:MAG: glycoside hydrolase family 16 protein [Acidimicrobiales bacterium]
MAALGLTVTTTPAGGQPPFPMGVPLAAEPSGLAPPGASALPGYRLRYVTDFPGRRVPSGWDVFTGVPGGDPGGQFGRDHVVVSGGLLHLNAWRDPRYSGRWVTGGLCHCGMAWTYGAFFVRSRITGGGANEVQLLWPANNQWPPEIDFNESGGSVTSTSSSLHFGSSTALVKHTVRLDMEAWHTWGVVWSPTAVTYVVDGQVWARVTAASQIPRIPLRLDLEQRTLCTIGQQCPRAPVSMLVDWVSLYSPLRAR